MLVYFLFREGVCSANVSLCIYVCFERVFFVEGCLLKYLPVLGGCFFVVYFQRVFVLEVLLVDFGRVFVCACFFVLRGC